MSFLAPSTIICWPILVSVMGLSGGLSHTLSWRKNAGASLAFTAACLVGDKCLLVAGAAAATDTLSCPKSEKTNGRMIKRRVEQAGKGNGRR